MTCRSSLAFPSCDAHHPCSAQAGVHSGDSACSIPPQTISADALATIREWTPRLAKALKVVGLINIQYVVQDNQVRACALWSNYCCVRVAPHDRMTCPDISAAR